jgi:hypothetical protein
MISIFDAIGNDAYVPDETGYKKEPGNTITTAA